MEYYMVKNILIISSDNTGCGHKSICEALCERFSFYENVRVRVIDGFSLGGKTLFKLGRSYGPITRKAKNIWRLVWKIQLAEPRLINGFIELIIKESFLSLFEETKPDIILCLHPNFNGPVLNTLKKCGIKIPFVTIIADLVSICPQWVDSRADYILSPTHEAKNKCVQFNFPEEKLKVFGFPVRSRFSEQHVEKQYKTSHYSLEKPLNCLIMCGGDGTGNMRKIATVLLENFNCTVKIVAGRNAAAKKRLENILVKYGNRVEVFGFVDNIQDLMLSSDIVFTRGSPNVMMEVISCNTPLVITGALPGQEEGNPDFIKQHNLGVVCENMKDIQKTLVELLSDNATKLSGIKESQRVFINPDSAKQIVDFILMLNK
jgi:processive 1,2-diacylglycerol beta-glucosyltransferase